MTSIPTASYPVGIEVTDAYYKLGSDRVRFALEADSEEETSE